MKMVEMQFRSGNVFGEFMAMENKDECIYLEIKTEGKVILTIVPRCDIGHIRIFDV